MTIGVGYPLAFTLATSLAMSSASEVRDRALLDFEIPPRLVYGFDNRLSSWSGCEAITRPAEEGSDAEAHRVS